ncbi:MAG: restriction endonuclease subunit S [Ramlibacter sp.]|nr:restriction endonuclease subunit S [Ramlibacter sp.]
MSSEWEKFTDLLSAIVDNRGKTCPVGESGLPLIATNCVNGKDLYPNYETNRFVSDETYKTWFRGHPKPGDILFVCKGSPGRTSWVPDPVDFCIAQDMVAIRANPAKIYPKYLLAVLRSDVVRSQIDNMHVGTMIPHFKKGDFDKLKIPVLDGGSQIAVGDLYFQLSEQITLLRETNATLEAIAQALFKSWFVDFDPVRAKMEGRAPEGMDEGTAALFPDGFEESDIGLVPRGWQSSTLAAIANLNAKSWVPRSAPPEIAYVDLAGVKNNVFEMPQTFLFTDAPSRARRVLRVGDSIIGTVRPGNRSFGFVAATENNLTGSTGFAVLSPKQGRAAAFIYLCATRDDNIGRLESLADGGAYPAVKPELVSTTTCTLPTDEVMNAFDGAARPMLDSIAANSSQAQILAALRDTLLPRLISGQLRLPEAEALAAEAMQ